jgi:hypothetical protein
MHAIRQFKNAVLVYVHYISTKNVQNFVIPTLFKGSKSGLLVIKMQGLV